MAKKVSYTNMMEYGVESIRKNLILFLPNIMMLVVSICLLLILYNVGGVHDLLATKPFILNDKAVFSEELGRLISTPRFTLSAVVWILGEILIGAYFVVVKYGMIRDVVLTGKTTMKSGLEFGEKNYLKYWGLHIVSYLLVVGPFFILLAIYSLFIKSNMPSINFSHLVLGLFVLGWLVYAFLMVIRLFFLYPVMAFEKKDVFQTFDEDFHYVKTHMGHTFLSYLIVLAFAVGLRFVTERVEVFSMSLSSQTILIVIALLMLIFEIFITTWEHIFIFKSYEEGKRLKKQIKSLPKKKKKKNAK